MPEKIVKLSGLSPAAEEEILQQASQILKAGGVVIVPTDTVYGVVASSKSAQGYERLMAIKKRPSHKHFLMIIDQHWRAENMVDKIPLLGYKLMYHFWPGALSIIFACQRQKEGIGLRLPNNYIARRLVELTDAPLFCPSANFSTKPAPVDFGQIDPDLIKEVDMALDAGAAQLGKDSTIVKLNDNGIDILRESAISKEEIYRVINTKRVLFVCTGNSCRSVMAQELLRRLLKDKGRDDVEVSSAGVMLLEDIPPSQETLELLREEGIDAASYRSQRISKEMLLTADLILAMEKVHVRRILEIAPQVAKRVFLLKEFASIGNGGDEIEDPIGKDKNFYRKTFLVIKEAVQRLLEVL